MILPQVGTFCCDVRPLFLHPSSLVIVVARRHMYTAYQCSNQLECDLKFEVWNSFIVDMHILYVAIYASLDLVCA